MQIFILPQELSLPTANFKKILRKRLRCINCLGTGKVAYGTGRSERKLVSPEIIKQIETKIKLQADNQGVIWEILLKVPLRTFCFHDIETLEGQSCRANFYKCGDDREIPHYLSWQKIETPKPDFHQPKFFGELDFQP